MRSFRLSLCAMVLIFFSGVIAATAQTKSETTVTQYTFYDVGTLGGNFSAFYSSDLTGGDFTPSALNQRGQLAGVALYAYNSAGSFLWNRGKLVALPTLPHGNELGGGSNAL